MVELDELREIRQSVSLARESCAGSNVQDKYTLVSLLDKSIGTATKFNYVNLPIELVMIEKDALKIKDYGDRLPLDDKLCKILNDLDKKIEELE